MLNYMKSEMYRAVKNRNLILFMGACMGILFALVMVLVYFTKDPKFPYATVKFALSNIYMSMSTMLLLTVAIAAIIDNNEYKNHTLKHSVSFGMKRIHIFLARFIAMVLNATIVYLIITGFFVLISGLFLQQDDFFNQIMNLTRISLASFSCLVSGIAITYVFLLLIENPITAAMWIVVVLTVLPRLMALLGMKVPLFARLNAYTPLICLSIGGEMITSTATNVHAVLVSCLVGLGWTVAFLIVGAICFERIELK
ncbi:MAG: type transport system permease protein [Clostridiales bacterium]|nr:type transport system permease protein [Clostridiales bacterium]